MDIATTIVGTRIMGSEQTFHITVAYQDGPDAHVTKVYAIDTKTFRKLHRTKDWLGRARDQPTGEALAIWLKKMGCKLDSPDGPAFVQRFACGNTVERYYRNGEPHREDGPAVVAHKTDGRRYESYYVGGNLQKYLVRSPDGTVIPLSLSGPPHPRYPSL
jgi:hypothetical protein